MTEPTVPRPGRADDASRQWLLLATAVYVLRIFFWSGSELWYDEVLTLQLFGIRPASPLEIFRDYTVANNHFLNSAMLWVWVRALDFRCGEQLLRLPSMLLGWGTIAVVCLHWRRLLGDRLANLGAVLLAASPVFGAFAYQLRGYSMTMFLSAAAVSGTLDLLHLGRPRRGQAVLCAASFLLPLAMPSALLTPAALGAYILLEQLRRRRPLRETLGRCLPCGLAALGGFSHYLCIFDQFRRCGAAAGGWDSGPMVLLALGAALLAHGGILCGGLLLELSRLLRRRRQACRGVLLAGAALLPVLGSLVLRFGGHAPFPRVYLALLPVLTFALLLAVSETGFLRDRSPYVLLAVLLSTGCAVESCASALTGRQVADGKAPQNLLQQYYRGASDNRDMAAILKESSLWLQGPVLVNAVDEMAFSFYWQLNGLPLQAVFAVNRLPPGFEPRRLPFRVMARNEIEAARMFAAVGWQGPFHAIVRTGARFLYAQGMEAPRRPRTTPAPPGPQA